MITSINNAEHYNWGHQCDGWHLLKSENLSVIQERMPPGTFELLHYHQEAQQVFYILSGTATFEFNGQTVTVKANESIHVPKNTRHRILNNTNGDLHFMVISSPRSHGDRINV